MDVMVWVRRPASGSDGPFISLPFCLSLFSLWFRSLLSFPTLCVPPPLSSFSSLLFLLSCLRAVVIPLFVLQSFDPPAVLFSQSCLIPLSLSSRANGLFTTSHLHRLLPPPSPAVFLPLYPVPDRRATAYCTYVFSAICVLVRYSTLSLSSLDCASIFRFVFGRLLWSVEPEVPERKRHQICTWLCPTSSTSETVAGASGDLRFAACCGLVASLDPRQLFRVFRSGL